LQQALKFHECLSGFLKARITSLYYNHVLIAVLLLFVVFGQSFLVNAEPTRTCPAKQRPIRLADGHPLQPTNAIPDTAFNALFTRYRDGWTGGDGTYSILLPDTRTLWMFGDTFLGRVNPDRSRPRHTPLINNSFVIQDNSSMVTLHGGTKDVPAALIAPPERSYWYWPADGTLENKKLRVFLRKFKRIGPGLWDWIWMGTDVGSFGLPDVKLQSLKPSVSDNKVLYGSAILEDDAHTFIYGTEDLKRNKYAHIARTVPNQLLGRWEFFTGKGWSQDPKSSVRILEGVANQFSVLKVGNFYCLITMDNREPFGSSILAYLSYSPCGPWSKPVLLYTTPEANGDIVTYNAFAHPQFAEQRKLLISYNINHIKRFKAVFDNADLYRPKFIRVDMQWLKEF
jgi:hypothetical protein